MNRAHPLSIGLAACVLLTPVGPARAQVDAAAWNRDIERLDFLTNPPERGDSRFFTAISTASGNTNVSLVYPGGASMRDFTDRLYRIRVDLGGSSPTGCTNAYLNGLTYFMPTNVTPPAGAANLQGVYASTKTYPDPETSYAGGGGGSAGFSSSSYYRYRNWPAGTSSGTSETAANACTNAGGAAQQAACVACVTTRGYWLNPLKANNDVTPGAAVFAGNWLNFHPPKWVLLRLAYKRLVNGPLLSILREAVVAANGTTGGQVVQKMLPQSCNGNGRPLNQKLGAVDGLSYASPANPIAEMLFNSAWYMGGQENPWYFNHNAQSVSAMGNGKSGPCDSCSGDFLVLFSDGRGDSANPSCSPVAGVTPPHCTAAALCATQGLGAEDDGDDYFNAATGSSGTGAAINGPSARLTPAGTCEMDFADDVARWAHTHDVSMASPSKLTIYVVGVGDPSNTYGELSILQEIAAAGGGEFTAAGDFSRLESNIEYVLTAILRRATSFSSSSATTVQTRGITSAFLPRFRPLEGAQWWGDLLRFQLFNEFAGGCTSADAGRVTAKNPNGNASCNDFYVLDANGRYVGEDADGNFVVLDETKPWTTTGWPARKDAGGNTIAASPVWSASERLSQRVEALIAGTSTNARTLVTVLPSGTGYGPALTPLDEAHAPSLVSAFALGGVAGDTCTLVASLARATHETEADCAAHLIRFLHGRDVFRQNPFNRTTPQPTVLRARPNVLGDVFHSSPITVTPPVPTFLCDLGVATQCTSSLYASKLTPGGYAAYAAYVDTHKYRTQFALVGANDGMLHAINAGNDTVDAQGVHRWDSGTGDEMWGFVPPDLLPKLQRYAVGERHELFVDGTPLVRDIWVDGSGATSADGRKQADEFHTIAIVTEREGGRSYVALDVTSPQSPRYLWTWPKPGTTEALAAGESWSDVAPGPPPIGPIAMDDPDGPLTVNGVRARERYVIAVGGGWDPAMLRGRSLHVLDAWTGEPIFRFARNDATSATDPRTHLFPIAAPVSMLDTDADGLFDAAVAPDTGGQVWTIAMQVPGKDTDADGRIDNWFGARAFVQFKGQAMRSRSPFFQPAAAAVLPTGEVRVFVGSGQRDNMKEPNGGVCGLANIGACLRKDCTVDMKATTYRVGAAPAGGTSGHSFTAQWKQQSGGVAPAVNTILVDTLGQSVAASDVVDANVETTIQCGSTTRSYASLAYCDWGATATAECPVATGRPPGTKVEYTPSFALESSRFYSFRLFDGTNRQRFATAATAATYDQNALGDANLVNAGTTTASSSGNGWYVVHAHSTDEKTAAGPLLLGGCVLWNTHVPNPDQALTCGQNTMPPDTAWAYQGDAITGAIACGQSGTASYAQTVRSTSWDTYVPPQASQPVISVNTASGQVVYGGLAIPPGRPPLAQTVGTGDAFGPIHWLEVTPRLHECRHEGLSCR